MESELFTLAILILGSGLVTFAARGIKSAWSNRKELNPKALTDKPKDSYSRALEQIRAEDAAKKEALPAQPYETKPPTPAPPPLASPVESRTYEARIDPTLLLAHTGEPLYEAFVLDEKLDKFTPPAVIGPTIEPDGKVWLHILKGEYVGQRLEIPRDGLVIGRNHHVANLVLPYPEISGRHLKMSTMAGKYLTIEDLNSMNGTRIQSNPHETMWEPLRGERTFHLQEHQPFKIELSEGVAIFEVIVSAN